MATAYNEYNVYTWCTTLGNFDVSHLEDTIHCANDTYLHYIENDKLVMLKTCYTEPVMVRIDLLEFEPIIKLQYISNKIAIIGENKTCLMYIGATIIPPDVKIYNIGGNIIIHDLNMQILEIEGFELFCRWFKLTDNLIEPLNIPLKCIAVYDGRMRGKLYITEDKVYDHKLIEQKDVTYTHLDSHSVIKIPYDNHNIILDPENRISTIPVFHSTNQKIIKLESNPSTIIATTTNGRYIYSRPHAKIHRSVGLRITVDLPRQLKSARNI